MTFDPLNPPRALSGPFPAVVPFTVRENPTQQYQIDRIIAWIRDTVVPFINDNVQELGDEWATTVTELIENWETLSASLIVQVQTIADDIGDAVTDAQAAQLAAENARDAAENFASTVVAFQDLAVSSLVNDVDSDTRQALETLFSSSEVVGTLGLRVTELETVTEDIPATAVDAVTDAAGDEESALRTVLDNLYVGGTGTVKSLDVSTIRLTSNADEVPNVGELLVHTEPPASWFTDFAGETIGVLPDGWQPRIRLDSAFSVQALPTAPSGRGMRINAVGSNRGLSNRALTEILRGSLNGEIALRYRSSTSGRIVPVRFASDAEFGDQSYYFASQVNHGGSTGIRMTLGRWLNGNDASIGIGDDPLTVAPNTDYIVVYRWRGIYQYAKLWEVGTPEPGWQVIGHDDLLWEGDWSGIVSNLTGVNELHWIGASNGNAAAPRGV